MKASNTVPQDARACKLDLPAREPGAAKGRARLTPAFFEDLSQDEIKAWS